MAFEKVGARDSVATTTSSSIKGRATRLFTCLTLLEIEYVMTQLEKCRGQSISLFNANLEKKGKKQPVWEILKAPRQPDSKQCEFYVMRYMKEIIESGSISKQFRKEPYSTKEIDEVRAEWADCVLDYV
ncbi:hypothetical protein C2S51_030468 [Perilla frutescens var. frutescens]|nr:hypothetical protein C2S51_030468 [Perilla frutescens var. frutescens]